MQLKSRAINKNFLENFEQYVNDISNDKFLELVNKAESLPWEYKLPKKNSNLLKYGQKNYN